MGNRSYVILTSLIVALGGFLLGFDASVISGVVPFIETYFVLDKIQLGWSVSCLTAASTVAMLVSGPISNAVGRRKVLMVASALFILSAVCSALATDFWFFVISRMIGGFGVGAALIIAPMYIAEISPPNLRGSMVSFNQLTIVFGISVAYFSNYFLLDIGDNNWRWMLGVETIPALFYFIFLFVVPESPRWLAMKGFEDKAYQVMKKASGEELAKQELNKIKESIKKEEKRAKAPFVEIFKPALRLVMIIAVGIAFFQQATGINAVLYYAPVILEQTGIGRDASFAQAIIIGLTNFGFTFIAIWLIDKVGRKPLLLVGLAGMAIFLFTISFGFHQASYKLNEKGVVEIRSHIKKEADVAVRDDALAEVDRLDDIKGITYKNDKKFKNAVKGVIGDDIFAKHRNVIITNAITINGWLILIAIIGYVAFFAMAIGPIIWVLLSELFPNRVRGLAVSFAGFINSVVSFSVSFIFPWELESLGNAGTFFIYGALAFAAWIFVKFMVVETKGKSLEELENILIKK